MLLPDHSISDLDQRSWSLFRCRALMKRVLFSISRLLYGLTILFYTVCRPSDGATIMITRWYTYNTKHQSLAIMAYSCMGFASFVLLNRKPMILNDEMIISHFCLIYNTEVISWHWLSLHHRRLSAGGQQVLLCFNKHHKTLFSSLTRQTEKCIALWEGGLALSVSRGGIKPFS